MEVKLGMGQVFLRELRYSAVTLIASVLHTHVLYVHRLVGGGGGEFRYMLDDWKPVVRFPAGAETLLIAMLLRPSLGPTQRTFWRALGAFFLPVKRPERDANHSSPSFKVKKDWRWVNSCRLFGGTYRLRRHLSSLWLGLAGGKNGESKLLRNDGNSLPLARESRLRKFEFLSYSKVPRRPTYL
jgi:hypothetical protein